MYATYLSNLLSPFVTNASALEIDEVVDERGKLLSVHVAKDDMGRIIGKSGETIKTVRSLVSLVGRMNKELVSVKINEPRL